MSTALRAPLPPLPSPGDVMEQARTENFPVASVLLGRRYRDHLRAIYGFARLVDTIGDELTGDRIALLDGIDRELSRIYAAAEPEHPLMRSLAETIATCGLPAEPLRRLVAANRRDQVITRYETFAQLLSYCRLSAAPVGELVLHVFGDASPERTKLSDRICAGLQVIEHMQDVGEDYARGRIYLPREDLHRFGCEEADLAASSANRSLRLVIASLAERSAVLLSAGDPLVRQLRGRARIAVTGFLAGGRATLAGIEHANFDVLTTRPRRTARGFALALWNEVRER